MLLNTSAQLIFPLRYQPEIFLTWWQSEIDIEDREAVLFHLHAVFLYLKPKGNGQEWEEFLILSIGHKNVYFCGVCTTVVQFFFIFLQVYFEWTLACILANYHKLFLLSTALIEPNTMNLISNHSIIQLHFQPLIDYIQFFKSSIYF